MKPRKASRSIWLLWLLALLLAACASPNNLPPAEELGELAIGTAEGVTFQPPIGKVAVANGNFDQNVNLRFEVFKDRTSPTPRLVASFSRVDDTIKVVNNPGVEEHYHANWNTKASNLSNGTTVRIEVKPTNAQAGKPVCNDGVDVGKGCLAFVDVQLLQSRGKVTGGDSGDHFLDLVNGQTLPIKVHIEIGAVNAPDPQSGIVITSDRSFVFTGSGDTAQLTVAVVGDDGRVDPSADTSFSSSNPDVVTVDPSGLLTAQSDDLGSAVITVSSGNLQPVVATAVVADLTPETVYLQNNDVIEVDADTGQVILVRTPKTAHSD